MIEKGYGAFLRFIQKYIWVFLALALLVLGIFCFHHLDVKYVDSWDEARHGVNAYEMTENGNYIQHTYNYEVDDWNLKPSISYWSILIGYKLFGYSVFGLRFISALAYLLTGLFTALFIRKRTKIGAVLVLGFFCANVLPLTAHLARAADADSLYLLFFTLAMLVMMDLKEKPNRLWLCGLFFSLAFLTKSWHAGMIAVIGGLYLILTGQIRKITLKNWLKFIAATLIPLIVWFGLRATADGLFFLKQMIEVDLLARTGTSNFEGHAGPFSFYWTLIFGNRAFIYPWLTGIAAAAVIIWIAVLVLKKKKPELTAENPMASSDMTGLLLWFALTFLGFSAMKVKLIWYCYPAIIPVFILSAILIGRLIEMKVTKRAELLTAGKAILMIGAAVLTIYYMNGTYDTAVRSVKGDGFQDFLKLSLDRDSEYATMPAFIQIPGEVPEQLGDWDQNRLLLAELYGNLRCYDGGTDGFLEYPESALLMIDRENYAVYQEELAGLETVYLNEGYPYVILKK